MRIALISHYLLVLIVLILSFRPAAGQSTAPASEDILRAGAGDSPGHRQPANSAAAKAIQAYHQFMGIESPLYNGYEHLALGPSYKGSPYFHSDSIFYGQVVFDGSSYTAPMLYDQVLDQVVVAGQNGYMIGLFMPRISSFDLFGHHFIHNARGTFDQLTLGRISILVRRIKRVEDVITNNELIHNINPIEDYYAVKDGVYYPVSSQSGLLDLMKEKKPELKAFIRAQKIRFRRDRENAMVAITNYYNQLPR